MKRTVLYTNEQAFNSDVKEYGNRVRLETELKAELKRLLPNGANYNSTFFKNTKSNFYKALGKEYPKHLELMKVNKIPDMIDMDTSKLFSLINEYENGDGLTNKTPPNKVKSPSIHNYEIVAETEKEIEQLQAIQKVIDAVKEAEVVCDFKARNGAISQGTMQWAYADLYDQELRFNHTLILSQRRIKERKLEKV